MNYGEIKAQVFLGLGDSAPKVSVFQLGEAIDAAQSWIVNTLPSELLQELHVAETVTITTGGVGPAPANFVKEIVVLDSSGGLYRILSKADFEMYKGIGTYDTVCAVSSSGVYISPAPAPAEGFALTYLRSPEYYVINTDGVISYQADTVVPDFNPTLHQIIVDYAIATAAQQAGDMNLYQAKMSNAYIAAKGKGAQIDIGNKSGR
jgi:hypothetical protein